MDRFISGLANAIGGSIGFAAESGILFAIFGLLWLAVGAGLIWSQGSVDAAWSAIRGLPLIIQVAVWVLFLPVMAGLWIWESTWPQLIRIVLVAGVASLSWCRGPWPRGHECQREPGLALVRTEVYTMGMQRLERGVLMLLSALVAVTAIPGAIWVVPTIPLEWIKRGPFTDWTVPALALGFVGGLAVVTFVALVIRPWLGALASVVAGAAMVAFELVEIAIVGWTLSDPGPEYFQSWLQLVYLVVGSVLALVGLSYWRRTREDAPPFPVLHPMPG